MNKMIHYVLIFSVIIIMGVAFFWLKSVPKIVVSSEKALIDEPVEISISNLSANELVTIEASCKDKDSNIWISHATFQADEKGIVNVAKQAPLSGSYNDIDPMGLFWSMMPANKEASYFSSNKPAIEVSLTLLSEEKRKANKTIYRLLISPNVEKRDVREQGIVGTLFYPKHAQKCPGIIVVSGSDGGIPKTTAQLIASHGYTVLALAYFAAEGLPNDLESIPLEYFQSAMQWFKKQAEVDEKRIALFGSSRGGELVLLLAATFPQAMNAVIAYMPSGLIYGGFPQYDKPAWTYKNLPIPFMHVPSREEFVEAAKAGKIPFHRGTFEDPYEISYNFLYGIKFFCKDIETATIPVENIRCPILLISGEDDKMWPSNLYCNLITERLNKKGSSIERKHLNFPGAGHGFEFPYVPASSQPFYHPIGKFWCTLGGTVKGNALASKHAWAGVLNFLDETLNKN